MKNLDESAERTDGSDLEFPDWSGMDDASSRVNPEAAFALLEQYQAWFPDLAVKWNVLEREKCTVDFVL